MNKKDWDNMLYKFEQHCIKHIENNKLLECRVKIDIRLVMNNILKKEVEKEIQRLHSYQCWDILTLVIWNLKNNSSQFTLGEDKLIAHRNLSSSSAYSMANYTLEQHLLDLIYHITMVSVMPKIEAYIDMNTQY